MSPSDKVLCDEWIASLQHWVEVAVASSGSVGTPYWGLNSESIDRMKPLLQQAKPEDIAALFGDFGVGLLHSLLGSFEQKEIIGTGIRISGISAKAFP